MKTYTLIMDDGPLKGRHYPISAAGVKLGRSSQCDIAINDLQLSRSHCRFELRGDTPWLIDLASANQTFVNGIAVTEYQLKPGDVIQAGQNVLHMEEGDGALPDVVIDLGFGKDESPSVPKKSVLRPLIWSLAAMLILITGATLILDPDLHGAAKAPPKPQALKKDTVLLVNYEKVEADTNTVFRYAMTLSPDGMLAVRIDDLSAKDRHVRKEKQLDADRVTELAQDIESGGFFTLEKTYTGFAAQPNTLNEWTLTCAIGKKVHTCRVTNRTEPDAFRAIREKLETFSKNELGIWAIQFSTDKLTELARDTYAIAQKKFDERDVQYGNLFNAIRAYQEATFYLETVDPKPDFYAEIVSGAAAAQTELEKRYADQRFRADRAINLSDWPTAAQELRVLCEMIPDRSDPRHKEATRKLVDVENRLKKDHR